VRNHVESEITSAQAETETNPPEATLKAGARNQVQRPIVDLVARCVVLVVLFATPALMCLKTPVMDDPDVWWHLRTGQWILEHHAVPHTDPYSIYALGKPWQAYSWLFEIVILKIFARWNLVGIALYTSAMVAAATMAIFRLVNRLQPDFSKAVLLTITGVIALSGILTPRPWMFTIVFFALEVDLLMQARRTGRVRPLFWLPLLFAVWANIHIQFVDGLVILGVAAVEPLVDRKWPWPQTRLRPAGVWAVLAACALATLANPYGWRVYQIAYQLVSERGVDTIITELLSLRFRDPVDYLLLLMALASAAALAWRRRFPFFESMLLGLACYLSFHSVRDRWFLVVVACAILAPHWTSDESERRFLPEVLPPILLCLVWALLFAGVAVLRLNNSNLNATVAETMPEHAVEAVKKQGLTGPLFNVYDWGGYLIWALRDHPVSIDGRAALYGSDRVLRNINTWSGKPGWDSDPDLLASGFVIAPAKLPLAQLLRLDPRFKLVYKDGVAQVYVHQPQPAPKSEPVVAHPQSPGK
jgi:hypothetical protein